jgi:outer membrane protein assembly factor BamB
MRRIFGFFSFSVICLGFSPRGGAQEWTRFRGPNGAGLGVAEKFPAELSERDFFWKIELPGRGHSSPVVWGERIFVTSNPPETTQRVISCVSAADGKTLWKKGYATGGYRQHADNNYASATPAVDAERVYFHWASPEGSGLVALDQKDGREVWKVDLGPFLSKHGPGTSPIVFEDVVVLDFDQDEGKSFLLAVDAKTGRPRWRREHEGTKSSASTPCIFTPKSGAPQVITESFATGVVASDTRSGAVVWQLPSLMTRRCVSSPFVTPGGLIIAQCGEGRAESFVEAVRPAADGKSAVRAYGVLRVGGYVPTPIAVGELLFLWKENGLVSCVRSATGEQLWSERVEGAFYGSPVCVNGRLYNMTMRGDLVVLAVGEKFQPPQRLALGEGSHATPAVSGGRMYLRTFTHLIAVGR